MLVRDWCSYAARPILQLDFSHVDPNGIFDQLAKPLRPALWCARLLDNGRNAFAEPARHLLTSITRQLEDLFRETARGCPAGVRALPFVRQRCRAACLIAVGR